MCSWKIKENFLSVARVTKPQPFHGLTLGGNILFFNER